MAVKNLPTYELVIDDNPSSEFVINAIALVDKPAMKKSFLAFDDAGSTQKISFEYNNVLNGDTAADNQAMVQSALDKGHEVHIISDTDNQPGLEFEAKKLGIKSSNVHATGSKEAKIAKVKELGINNHIDSDKDVIDALGIGKTPSNFKKVAAKFAVVDMERGIISGVAMLANTPIYRNDKVLGECMVTMSPETIEKAAIKFFELGFANNFNIMHNGEKKLEGITVFESFISDVTRGIPPMKGFEDAPDGTWFISAKVNNPEIKQNIIDGLYTGFSVEGMFGAINTSTGVEDEVEEEFQNITDEILQILNS